MNIDKVSQLTCSPLPLGIPYTQISAPPAASVQHDTSPDRNCHQIPKGGEDPELIENRRRRRRSPLTRFLCPVSSCCRNQGTLRKPFGRTDNLRTHLKTVHSLPITDGVKVPKWIVENPGEVKKAEDRAQAGLSLRC